MDRSPFLGPEQRFVDEYTGEVDSFPRSEALTGTFAESATDTVLVGTTTAFYEYPNNDTRAGDTLRVGDYLVDKTQKEIRKVLQVIEDNQEVVIESAFTADPAGATLHVARAGIVRANIISDGALPVKFYVPGGTMTTYTMATDERFSFGDPGTQYAPFLIDASAVNGRVTNGESML